MNWTVHTVQSNPSQLPQDENGLCYGFSLAGASEL